MGKTHAGSPLDYRNRFRQAIIAGGLYKLAKRGLGRGLLGFALPAAALLIEDLTNPGGVVLPFLRWLLSRHGKVRIIEVSCRPPRKPGEGAREGSAEAPRPKDPPR